ncbi:hypothetical protein HY969_03000 [Candidatus Kaiserbacteria bacterium]|nr:hypothetical protein [Candidatus Kaiserbacteria bacterium]
MRRPKTGEYVGGRVKSVEQQFDKRELTSQGWKTRGDVPFAIVHRLNVPKKRIFIDRHVSKLLSDVLDGFDADVRSKQLKLIGKTLYYSPEVVQKLEEKVKFLLSSEKGDSAETTPSGNLVEGA